MTVQGNKAAWSRGGKGFIAISNEGEWSGTFQTGMPAGQYCNVIKVRDVVVSVVIAYTA